MSVFKYEPNHVFVEWAQKLVRGVLAEMVCDITTKEPGGPMVMRVEGVLRELGPPPMNPLAVPTDYAWLMGLVSMAREYDAQAMSNHGLMTHYLSLVGGPPGESLNPVAAQQAHGLFGDQVPDAYSNTVVESIRFLIQDRNLYRAELVRLVELEREIAEAKAEVNQKQSHMNTFILALQDKQRLRK
jgi:hypothetical protein